MLKNVFIYFQYLINIKSGRYKCNSTPIITTISSRKRTMWLLLLQMLNLEIASAFWDIGTTTTVPVRAASTPRQSFFRWQWTYSEGMAWWFYNWDWELIWMNRKLRCMAGISIDMIPLGTAILLNRRTLITSANYLEPYLDRQQDLRIWALGREGVHTTPYRYRVWRVRRLIPKSNNPEHWHGPTGEHVPRHDVAIIHSHDQIYLYTSYASRYNFANRALIPDKRKILEGYKDRIWFAGCGFENLKHIRENYKIKHASFTREHVVDCSKYLPKWWGKFICMVNIFNYPGLGSGSGLFVSDNNDDYLVGIGCFEIRYNEDRIMVFTDVRYYVDWINIYANITPGDYYEYAYPKWSVTSGHWFFWDSGGNNPYIPTKQVRDELFPLG